MEDQQSSGTWSAGRSLAWAMRKPVDPKTEVVESRPRRKRGATLRILGAGEQQGRPPRLISRAGPRTMPVVDVEAAHPWSGGVKILWTSEAPVAPG
jgi:hypothetical protein